MRKIKPLYVFIFGVFLTLILIDFHCANLRFNKIYLSEYTKLKSAHFNSRIVKLKTNNQMRCFQIETGETFSSYYKYIGLGSDRNGFGIRVNEGNKIWKNANSDTLYTANETDTFVYQLKGP